VGFGNAVANASLARGGDFSGLVGFEKYQFLKRLAMLGGLSMVFVPFIILDGKRVFSSFLFIFVIALLIYLQTVSRVIFLETVAVFILLFFSLRQRKGGVFYLCLVPFFVFFAFVFLYGKTFVASLSLYFSSGGDFNLIEGGSLESQLSKFFGHFGHLIYSVDAGIRNYFAVGPVFPDDVLLAPIGIIPSFMLSSVGLDWLSYQLVPESERMSCINSGFFSSSNGCMVPPYFSGFSAYLMPLGGALIFGFFRFWIYSVIEACWVRFRARPELIWFAYLLFIVFNQIMLIIPATISFSFFVVILFLALLFVRRLLLVRF
jgi:hypothetical protein